MPEAGSIGSGSPFSVVHKIMGGSPLSDLYVGLIPRTVGPDSKIESRIMAHQCYTYHQMENR